MRYYKVVQLPTHLADRVAAVTLDDVNKADYFYAWSTAGYMPGALVMMKTCDSWVRGIVIENVDEVPNIVQAEIIRLLVNYEERYAAQAAKLNRLDDTKGVKHDDQILKADAGKPRLSLVPPEMLWAVGEVMTFGAQKYSPNSWRKVEPERYMDALARHFALYLADPDGVDDESGLPHLWHLTTNAAFLCALSSVSPVMKAVKLPEPGYADKLMKRVCEEGLLPEVKDCEVGE